MDTTKIEQWLEEYKHLTGAHNQKRHGNRVSGGGTPNVSAERAAQENFVKASERSRKAQRAHDAAPSRQTEAELKSSTANWQRAKSLAALEQARQRFAQSPNKKNKKLFEDEFDAHTKLIADHEKQGFVNSMGREIKPATGEAKKKPASSIGYLNWRYNLTPAQQKKYDDDYAAWSRADPGRVASGSDFANEWAKKNNLPQIKD